MLQKTNYAECLAAFQDACVIADADWLLKDDYNPQLATTELQSNRIKPAVKNLIRKSLGKEIWSELSVNGLVGDLDMMLDAIEKVNAKNNEAAHRHASRMLRRKLFLS